MRHQHIRLVLRTRDGKVKQLEGSVANQGMSTSLRYNGRLTVSPTPARQICAQAAHYGTNHGSDNEPLDVHRTSPPNYTFANETYFGHLNLTPPTRTPAARPGPTSRLLSAVG
jgi:hypothetical protein